MRTLVLALGLVATLPITAAVDARPPRHGIHPHHPVCRTTMRHGHRARVCR